MVTLAGFERPLIVWHRDAEGRAYCRQIDKVSVRWFRKLISPECFSEPCVAFDGVAFGSVLRSAHELVLIDQRNGDRYTFNCQMSGWWQHWYKWIAVNLNRAAEVERVS